MNDWAEGQECGEGRGGKNFRSSLALASSGPSKNEPVSGKLRVSNGNFCDCNLYYSPSTHLKKCRRDAGLENHTYLPQGHWPCLHSFSKNWPFLPAPRILRQNEWPHYLSTSVCLFSYPAENKKNVHPVGFQISVKNSKLVLSGQNQVSIFLSSSLWVFPLCLVFLLCCMCVSVQLL